MRWKRFPRKRRRTTKRGRRIPYIYTNRIYLGKRSQTGSGALSRVIARLLINVRNVIFSIGRQWRNNLR